MIATRRSRKFRPSPGWLEGRYLLAAAAPVGPQPPAATYDFTPDPTSPPGDGGPTSSPPPPGDGPKGDSPGIAANPNGGDPVVSDNPQVPANGQNLTVVVIAGSPEERLAWAKQARQYYGPGAIIITGVHNVTDLGNQLAQLPAESVGTLVLGGHGNNQGMQLGNPGVATSKFNTTTLTNNPTALDQLTTTLGPNAAINIQACEVGSNPTEVQNLSNLTGTAITAAQNLISGSVWNDPNGGWTTTKPK